MTVHGNPNPRNTLVALLAVILSKAASAVCPLFAAFMLHQISGIEVPKASMVKANTVVCIYKRQPAVETIEYAARDRKNIMRRAEVKVGQPEWKWGGGMVAKRTFHGYEMICRTASIVLL